MKAKKMLEIVKGMEEFAEVSARTSSKLGDRVFLFFEVSEECMRPKSNDIMELGRLLEGRAAAFFTHYLHLWEGMFISFIVHEEKKKYWFGVEFLDSQSQSKVLL